MLGRYGVMLVSAGTAMLTTVYDVDGDLIVDNAEALVARVGAGTPQGTVTANFTGEVYADNSVSPWQLYKATEVGTTDWTAL